MLTKLPFDIIDCIIPYLYDNYLLNSNIISLSIVLNQSLTDIVPNSVIIFNNKYKNYDLVTPWI